MGLIYSIPPEYPYLRMIANYILKHYSSNLGKLKILLPTRRACRILQEELIINSGKNTIILPEISPISDINNPLDDPESQNNSFVIGKIEQQLILTNIIHQNNIIPFTIQQSCALSKKLGALFYEFESQNITINKLYNITKLDSAEHWLKIAEFLKNAYLQWQQNLNEIGKITAINYRDQLIQKEITQLQHRTTPTIIAGSSGSVNVVRELISTIYRHPNGVIFLPSLDLPEHLNQELPVTHICFHIKRLLDYCNIDLKDITSLAEISLKISDRGKFLTQTFIDNQKYSKLNTENALIGISYIKSTNLFEEAAKIAFLAKEILDNPENKDKQEIYIITNNSILIEKVSIFLARFSIKLDRTDGLSLLKTLPMRFFLEIWEVINSNFQTQKLIALLKHPYLISNEISQFEIEILRGPEIHGGLEALQQKILYASVEIKNWFEKFINAIKPLLSITQSPFFSFNEAIKAHIMAAENLTSQIWQDFGGAELAQIFTELLQSKYTTEPIDSDAYYTLITEFTSSEKVWNKTGDAKVFVTNPIEARLINAEHIILASLNDGDWPRHEESDPWMSKAMRKDLGLVDVDEDLSKSIHDFYLTLHAKNIYISRSTKVSGAETKPSRFLMRLLSSIEKSGNLKSIIPDQNLHNQTSLFFKTEKHKPSTEIEAKAKLKDWPRYIAATHIELLMRNPYSFYARKILNLYKLDDLAAEPSVAEFGNFIHEAIETYSNLYQENKEPEELFETMINIGNDILNNYGYSPATINLWWPKFKNIMAAFIKYDEECRKNLQRIFTEHEGKLQLNIAGHNINLTAKADRLEITNNKKLHVIDYKTGIVPSHKHVGLGISPQLLIEALIASEGGFKDIDNINGFELIYIKIAAGKPHIKENLIQQNPNFLKETKEGIISLLSYFLSDEAVFLSNPDRRIAPQYNDYAYLARFK